MDRGHADLAAGSTGAHHGFERFAAAYQRGAIPGLLRRQRGGEGPGHAVGGRGVEELGGREQVADRALGLQRSVVGATCRCQ
ncbi:MAG: hypothetical protein A2Y55_01635 [Actinobacteria bacterium RBG_16_68_12]|nr:MAG: hypothetical protein A2Y55_01635 [Actinobacteria bacterium RBG_16_68_12]